MVRIVRLVVVSLCTVQKDIIKMRRDDLHAKFAPPDTFAAQELFDRMFCVHLENTVQLEVGVVSTAQMVRTESRSDC